MADPARIAAEALVDLALDRVSASETYRALHRDKAIRNEIPFARFEAAMRERRACKAIASFARQAGELPEGGKLERRAA